MYSSALRMLSGNGSIAGSAYRQQTLATLIIVAGPVATNALLVEDGDHLVVGAALRHIRQLLQRTGARLLGRVGHGVEVQLQRAQEVVSAELVVVPNLDHQVRRHVQLRLVQAPEVLLSTKG